MNTIWKLHRLRSLQYTAAITNCAKSGFTPLFFGGKMLIKTLGIDSASLRFCSKHKIKTIKDLIEYGKLKTAIRRNPDLPVLQIASALLDDDPKKLRKASPIAYRWLKYLVFCLSDGSAEMDINMRIRQAATGCFLMKIPRTIRNELAQEGLIDEHGLHRTEMIADAFYIQEMRPMLRSISAGTSLRKYLKGKPYQELGLARKWYSGFRTDLSCLPDLSGYIYLLHKVRITPEVFREVLGKDVRIYHLAKAARISMPWGCKSLKSILDDKELDSNIRDRIREYLKNDDIISYRR